MDLPQETPDFRGNPQAGSYPLEKAVELLGLAKEQIAAYLTRESGETAGVDGEPSAPTPLNASQWERAILGPSLAAAPALAAERQALIAGVLNGDPGACSLAGQLLVFQATPTDRLPQLLKDIGEAYYHWQPKTQPGTTPMEEALVRWLQRRCEEAGLANTIELVHPGERFDISRHHAASRGVEITEVHGWIVLRDNGKVYMKATVSVR